MRIGLNPSDVVEGWQSNNRITEAPNPEDEDSILHDWASIPERCIGQRIWELIARLFHLVDFHRSMNSPRIEMDGK
jgi:hypothetical protein